MTEWYKSALVQLKESSRKSLQNPFQIDHISDLSTASMALMKAAQLWEKFILKDLTTFAKYAKVELTPPGPGEVGGIVRGAGSLVKDAATFKWAQVRNYFLPC